MPKLRIVFTVSIEYEANPNGYPKGATAQEMLAIDLENAEDDPFLLIGDKANWNIYGEVIEDKS